MSALDLDFQGRTGDLAEAGLLVPSEALDRFEPPPGVLSIAAGEKTERVRYGVRVSSLGLLIDPDTGSEAVELPAISHIPNSPHWFLGMVNLRGALVPVFDLKLALELEQAATPSGTMVLILDKGEKAVGMLIDGNPLPLKSLGALAQLPRLPDQLEGYVAAGYRDQAQVWLEFDHEGFFESLAAQSRM